MRGIGSAQHQLGVNEEVDQAGIAFHEFDDQGDDALQHLLQAHFPNHQAADFLKQAQLLLSPLESGLDFLEFGHLSNYMPFRLFPRPKRGELARMGDFPRIGVGLRVDSEPYSWADARYSFSIECPADMMDRMRNLAMSALFAMPRGGLEIGGVLFGSFGGGRVLLRTFRELECEHAAGPSFILSDADQAKLAGLLASAGNDPELTGLAAVGWFRSRTRSAISMSQADIEVFDTYFPDPRQVFLVLRPEVTRPTRAAYFFREADGSIESSCLEFGLGPVGVAATEAAPVTPIANLKLLQTASPPRSHARALWLLALCVTLAGAAMAAREYLVRRAPAERRISLDAFDRGGQLQLLWDRSAPAIRMARTAKIDITDGAARYTTQLDPAQLRRGSFDYARQTERVDLRLTIVEANGRAAEEYVCFLGRLPVR